jgi:hypothetical protein
MENLNDKAMLESVRVGLLQQLQDLQGAPSVAMHQVPPLFDRQSAHEAAASADNNNNNNDDDDGDPDEREGAKTKSGDGTRKQHESELYDKVD